MKLILLRHGVTEANEKRLYCGSTDIGLSPSGRASLLSRRREKPYPDITGARILTSGMRRCEETLSLLFGDLPHGIDRDFRETDFGAFELRSYSELKDDPAYIAWITGDNEANTPPDGESGQMMTRRALRGLERLMRGGRDTLLVTHGGVIAAVMAYLFPSERRSRYEWQPAPGGGYVVDTDKREYTAF